MKVALIGVSGRVGSRLAAELLARGHSVTGIARESQASAQASLTVVPGNATKAESLVPLIRGHDAVISATRFVSSDPQALVAAVKQAGVPRLLVVGGAASLLTASGVRLLDTPGFPAAFLKEATAGAAFLDVLRREKDLDWTFLSPSAEFAPGERTGRFRLGNDELLVGSNGQSHISMEDFAIAMVDELENPRHDQRRFTVGY